MRLQIVEYSQSCKQEKNDKKVSHFQVDSIVYVCDLIIIISMTD